MVARVNGHSTGLLRRVMALEVAAQTLEPRLTPEQEVQEFWLSVHREAPTAVWDYIMAVDAEARAILPPAAKSWVEREHPCAQDVLDGLWHAIQRQSDDRLVYVQGWLLKVAYWRLGYHYARERAAGKTATVYDQVVREQAAWKLLDWTSSETNTAWQDPPLFLERWRVAGTSDAETLEHAGLHAAEVALLSAS